MISRQERYRGCLLGLATGDAVGTTVEFSPPGSFEPVTDMVGGGPFGLAAGEWTDDTSMALCLAESLIERREFDAADQMQRYLAWRNDGHLSSNGRCFDIGGTVSTALHQYERGRNPFAGSTNPYSAGNGSIMRLAPVPLFFAQEPSEAIRMSGESSRTTHGADTCVAACRYLGGLIVGALMGASKPELLSPLYSPVDGFWADNVLPGPVREVASGSFRQKQPPSIKGSGYVVDSLEAALWAFHNSNSYKDGCLMAVNLGDDADTTAAVYGQLAGAYYGEGGIPRRWLDQLAHRTLIEHFADELFSLSR